MLNFIERVSPLTTQHLADYQVLIGEWSVENNNALKLASKHLNKLAKEGKLEKCDGFYRLKGQKTEGGEHALKVTDQLVKIIFKYPDSQVIREPYLPFGRQPDAAILTTKGEEKTLLFLEVELKNAIDYILGKIQDYENNGELIRQWFEETFDEETLDFCFHILFITNKNIEERPGVVVMKNYDC